MHTVSKSRPLKRLGFSNHVSAIIGLPTVNTEHAATVAEAIVSLHTKLDRIKLQTLRDDDLSRAPSKFSYRPVPKWSERIALHPSIAMLCTVHQQYHGEVSQPPMTAQSSKPVSIFFSCPFCGTPKQVAHIRMARGVTWNTLSCANELCRRKSSASKWNCICGTRWQSCPDRGPSGSLCGHAKLGDKSDPIRNRGQVAPVPVPLRPQDQFTMKQKRKQDAAETTFMPSKKRRASCTAVSWNPNLPKLPPSLAARFAHVEGVTAHPGFPLFQGSNSSSSSVPPRQFVPG